MRIGAHFGGAAAVVTSLDVAGLVAAARAAKVRQIVTPYAPVGPWADRLATLTPGLAQAGIDLIQIRRAWDAQFWPHAKKGFFPFKEQIPALLRADGLA